MILNTPNLLEEWRQNLARRKRGIKPMTSEVIDDIKLCIKKVKEGQNPVSLAELIHFYNQVLQPLTLESALPEDDYNTIVKLLQKLVVNMKKDDVLSELHTYTEMINHEDIPPISLTELNSFCDAIIIPKSSVLSEEIGESLQHMVLATQYITTSIGETQARQALTRQLDAAFSPIKRLNAPETLVLSANFPLISTMQEEMNTTASRTLERKSHEESVHNTKIGKRENPVRSDLHQEAVDTFSILANLEQTTGRRHVISYQGPEVIAMGNTHAEHWEPVKQMDIHLHKMIRAMNAVPKFAEEMLAIEQAYKQKHAIDPTSNCFFKKNGNTIEGTEFLWTLYLNCFTNFTFNSVESGLQKSSKDILAYLQQDQYLPGFRNIFTPVEPRSIIQMWVPKDNPFRQLTTAQAVKEYVEKYYATTLNSSLHSFQWHTESTEDIKSSEEAFHRSPPHGMERRNAKESMVRNVTAVKAAYFSKPSDSATLLTGAPSIDSAQLRDQQRFNQVMDTAVPGGAIHTLANVAGTHAADMLRKGGAPDLEETILTTNQVLEQTMDPFFNMIFNMSRKTGKSPEEITEFITNKLGQMAQDFGEEYDETHTKPVNISKDEHEHECIDEDGDGDNISTTSHYSS